MNKEVKNELMCKNEISNSRLLPIEEEIQKKILLKDNNIIVTDKHTLKKLTIEALTSSLAEKNIHLGIISNRIITRIKNEITDIKKERINELFKDNINYAFTIN